MSAAREEPRYVEPLKLWRHVFGGERGLVQVFTAIRDGDRLVKPQANYFSYPQSAKAAAEWALSKSDEEREVYFCAHLLSAPERIKANAGTVIAAWGELDGGELPDDTLKPTAVVESSPGHYHVYWRLTDAIPPETAERLNRRLALEIEADPSGFDLTQLLRVPGTVNHKYEDAPLVTLLEVEGARAFSPAELDQTLPDPEKSQERPATSDGEEPPVVLDHEGSRIWRGENPKLKGDGTVDRSTSLMKVGRVLYDGGATRRVVIDSLRERDVALGWRCYSDRRDADKQYAAIFEKLQESGRNTREQVTLGGRRASAAGFSVVSGGRQGREREWPKLEEEAYRGLFGRIVTLAEEHTEGDPVALLAGAMTAFGSAVGRGPYMQIGATRHHVNLFVGIVGDTSKGRKGSTWDPVENVMHAADRQWAENKIQSGLSSGEGLISEVRDPVEARDKDGKMRVVDGGVPDKRLLVMEGELSQVLKVIKRDGNTLSPVLRNAWDGKNLKTMVKHSPLKATEPHVSILGHITRDELARHMTETEMANGLANRYLWLLVKRSKRLPFGGEWHTVNLQPVSREIVGALEYASREVRMRWADDARPLWAEAYEALTEDRPGMFGAVTARAEAQTLRLAMLYALADSSDELRRTHIESALAVWEYAEESARYIFGDAIGDPDADKVLEALKECEDGLTRTEVSNLFARNRGAEELDRIMAVLAEAGRLRVTKHRESGSKKPVERWYAA